MNSRPRSVFIAVALACYLALSVTWIVLSDQLLAGVPDLAQAVWLSTVKGVFFVVCSAAIFYLLLRAVPDAHPSVHEPLTLNMALGSMVLPPRKTRVLVYLFALTVSLLMLALRQAVAADLGERPMMILFMFPVILSALLGGLWPGLLSTAVVALGVSWMALPPVGNLAVTLSHDRLQWAFLIVNGVVVSLLSELLRQSVHKVRTGFRLLDAVVQGSSDAVFVKDKDGRYLLANQAVAGFVGKPLSEILGRDDHALFSVESAQDLRAKDLAVMALGVNRSHEERLTTQSGQQLAFLVTKGPVFDETGQVSGLFGISRDITEQECTARLLRESEERLQMTIEAVSDGVWDRDVRSNRVYRSRRYYEVIGYEESDDTRDYGFFCRILHPDDRDWVTKEVEAHERGETPLIALDCRVVTRQGDVRWMQLRGRVVERGPQGEAWRVVGTNTDITETRRLNDDLRVVLNEAADAIWVLDSGLHFLYANPAACQLTGHTPGEVLAMQASDLLPPEHHSGLVEHLARLETEHDIRQEWVVLHKNGTRVSVDLRTKKLQDGRYMAFGRDLTEERLAASALSEREHRLARVLEGSNQGYWDWDLRTQAIEVSPRFATMLGYVSGELNISGGRWAELVHPDDREAVRDSIARHRAGQTPELDVELRMRTAEGGWRWVLSRGRVVERDADGQPLVMSGTHTDITERKTFELASREAATVLDSLYEGVMVVALDRTILRVNPAFERITGYSAAEVVGQTPRMLSSGRHGTAFYEEMWEAIFQQGHWRGELWNRRKSGELFPELMSISAVKDGQGQIQHCVGVFADISQLKAHQSELDHMAHYDILTGLPNRRLLGDRLSQAQAHARRTGLTLAVCYLDLDGFKSVNDLHGHALGDKLLIQVADRLKGVLRGEDTLARLGGDEFVLLLSDLSAPGECHALAERVLHGIAEPMQIDGTPVAISASLGLTLFPQDDADTDTLLRHADQAMYLAKEAGKNRHSVFDPVHDRQVQAHREQLIRLGQAMANDEFVLHYQPKVDLLNGHIIGVEALIRWQHPERGLLSPALFIPHLEGSDLEPLVGDWVIRTALAQVLSWQRQGLEMNVSVNVGAAHLLHPGFHEGLRLMLKSQPEVSPSRLELEILETAGLGDVDRAVSVLQQCQALGVSFSLDDFGTGYSSLSYFRRLPVHMIKIDQSFVRDMLKDTNDFGIVESVVRLAHAFNRPVIAEGVETMEHGARLLQLGCHLAQGYGVARPMPADDLPAWVQRWKDDAPWKAVVATALPG